jgi:hypothetical protein
LSENSQSGVTHGIVIYSTFQKSLRLGGCKAWRLKMHEGFIAFQLPGFLAIGHSQTIGKKGT